MDPTVAQLLHQRAAADFPTPAQRRQGLPASVRELHQRILTHFAATNQAPPPATLAAWAIELDQGLQDALGRLVEADLVEADPASGRLTGAYPFVTSPRGHQVRLPGGLTMQAYCAVDALAIPAMLDHDATITSHDPLTSAPITIDVHDGQARWAPAGVVVGYMIDHREAAAQDGPAGQAACCRCPLINFHASPATAEDWQQREGVRLELLTIPQALQFAAATFGDLLRSPDSDDQDPGAAATAPWTIAGRSDPPTVR
jgi:alkylmercury lyase-like protein